MVGHSNRIKMELGPRLHIFFVLIAELHACGLMDSKHITLEEQATSFLCTCVTGMPIWHIDEHFQWSNETISKHLPPPTSLQIY